MHNKDLKLLAKFYNAKKFTSILDLTNMAMTNDLLVPQFHRFLKKFPLVKLNADRIEFALHFSENNDFEKFCQQMK